ncbi:MAG: coenzyme F420-0:L-glutamate ligase [Clostridiales bacterium]|jgi:hypothetical protein|nr:coenzyme F420-0:L-glutamate ligase [Clostridiales bacterium]
MRFIGTRAQGVRLPIINEGDNLAEIVAQSVVNACEAENFTLKDTDVIGITEAIVARAQGNYATIYDIAEDISQKFGNDEIGLVFPIMSRNRFLNILKGIAKGAKKVYVLLKYPNDEVGNPIIGYENYADSDISGLIGGVEFKQKSNGFTHPFTGIDYIGLYENAAPNISVYLSDNAADILKLTKNVLVCEIHSRFLTQKRLLKLGAQKVFTLSDILSSPVGTSGYNPDYGVLGSNLANDEKLKLFPKDCNLFVKSVREKFIEKTNAAPEILVYGDGAFKDPAAGIWELADPVVSPAHTERLSGRPDEIKLKYVADNMLGSLSPEEKQEAVTKVIKEKRTYENLSEGTTPRIYADLLGSLCDLVSGSGDKGTPVVLIQGYFDDYSAE